MTENMQNIAMYFEFSLPVIACYARLKMLKCKNDSNGSCAQMTFMRSFLSKNEEDEGKDRSEDQ